MRMHRTTSWMAGGAVVVGLLAGCGDPVGTGAARADRAAGAGAPIVATTPASVEWNEVARNVVARNNANTFTAFRVYTLVSVAQRNAFRDAQDGDERGHVSRRAAIATASAVVLGAMFPGEKTGLENRLRESLASGAWLEHGQVDAAAGEAIGRAVGSVMMEWAKTDGFADPWTGTLPAPGPSVWFGVPGAPPGGATIANARTWFLTSPDQFRPPPHPAFGSPEFAAALAEVKAFSEERKALTDEGKSMDSIAKFWAMGAGTPTPPGYWNAVASQLATRRHLNERRAVELLATLNMVGWDALVASNDAKYHYWLLRPSQADPSITLAITPLPNFPAYPSNHATISSAMAEVIAARFPSETWWLRHDAEQAALSRVYGGIHYRFDGDAGLELGRQIARWALSRSHDHRDAREGHREP